MQVVVIHLRPMIILVSLKVLVAVMQTVILIIAVIEMLADLAALVSVWVRGFIVVIQSIYAILPDGKLSAKVLMRKTRKTKIMFKM